MTFFAVVEPLVMFTSAYFSFICAETIHWSGIISLIGCGIAQKRYAFKNISEKSLTTVKYGVKTMSALADVIIFLFLGIVVISKEFGHFRKKDINSPKPWRVLETTFLLLLLSAAFCLFSYLVQRSY